MDKILVTFKSVEVSGNLVETSIEDVVFSMCLVSFAENDLVSWSLEDVGLRKGNGDEGKCKESGEEGFHDKENNSKFQIL